MPSTATNEVSVSTNREICPHTGLPVLSQVQIERLQNRQRQMTTEQVAEQTAFWEEVVADSQARTQRMAAMRTYWASLSGAQ
jgi:hypothetical protein